MCKDGKVLVKKKMINFVKEKENMDKIKEERRINP